MAGIRNAFATLGIAMAVMAGPAAGRPLPGAARPAESCRHAAREFRERLEAVTEAVIDGRVAAVPRASRRVSLWWATHRQAMPNAADADSSLRELVTAAQAHQPLVAARAAVEASVISLHWCEATPATALATQEQLMLVDLVGMSGWLRARGAQLEWPAGVQEATDRLSAALVARKHAALATRLRNAVAATLAAPMSTTGDRTAAIHLLDLVDVIEKVLP